MAHTLGLIINGCTYRINSPLSEQLSRCRLENLAVEDLARVTADLICLPQSGLNHINQVRWLHDWLVAYGRHVYGDGFIGLVCCAVIERQRRSLDL